MHCEIECNNERIANHIAPVMLCGVDHRFQLMLKQPKYPCGRCHIIVQGLAGLQEATRGCKCTLL